MSGITTTYPPKSQYEIKECGFCLKEFQPKDPITLLDCGHFFDLKYAASLNRCPQLCPGPQIVKLPNNNFLSRYITVLTARSEESVLISPIDRFLKAIQEELNWAFSEAFNSDLLNERANHLSAALIRYLKETVDPSDEKEEMEIPNIEKVTKSFVDLVSKFNPLCGQLAQKMFEKANEQDSTFPYFLSKYLQTLFGGRALSNALQKTKARIHAIQEDLSWMDANPEMNWDAIKTEADLDKARKRQAEFERQVGSTAKFCVDLIERDFHVHPEKYIPLDFEIFPFCSDAILFFSRYSPEAYPLYIDTLFKNIAKEERFQKIVKKCDRLFFEEIRNQLGELSSKEQWQFLRGCSSSQLSRIKRVAKADGNEPFVRMIQLIEAFKMAVDIKDLFVEIPQQIKKNAGPALLMAILGGMMCLDSYLRSE